MAIERAALAALMACGIGAASAGGPPAPWVGLVDQRQTDQPAQLYAPPGANAPRSLSFVQLAPAAEPPQVRCCFTPQGRPRAADDSGAQRIAAPGEATALTQQAARPSRRPTEPAVLLAFGGRGAQVQALSPQALLIRWPGRPERLHVVQCFSREGLHVRASLQPDPASGAATPPVQHFYLPLGMDVEPNCTAEMLAPPAR